MSSSIVEGGCIVIRPERRHYKAGDKIGFTLMSDPHIGARDNDYELIQHELDNARRNGDRVLINGDVFDMILPGDRKRFSPDVLHPSLQGRRDVLTAAVEMGAKILAPYADLIDMIGCGNHETAVEKYHSSDPVMMPIDKLYAALPKNSKHTIHYGGYMGFVDYRFSRSKVEDRIGSTRRFVLFYWHGGGAGAPVTKGMIDFHRLQWVDADCIWMGHKHNRFTAHIRHMECPRSGDAPVLKDIRQIMTGSYFNTYNGQSQKSIRDRGRLSNYAADAACAPQGKGGARVLLSLSADSYDVKVQQ